MNFTSFTLLLSRIKNDDKLIQLEGVESLSEQELRQACRDRGHLGLLSTEEMRQQVLFSFLSLATRGFHVAFSICQEPQLQWNFMKYAFSGKGLVL